MSIRGVYPPGTHYASRLHQTQPSFHSFLKTMGVYFVRGRYFRCTFEDAKRKFFSSFNAVYSKIGLFASEEEVVNLLDTKCIAPMLYGIEACPVTSRHKHSLDFIVTRVFMKILCTKSNDIVLECQNFFGFLPVSQRIAIRTSRFLERFICSENLLCNVFKRRALCHKNVINLR